MNTQRVKQTHYDKKRSVRTNVASAHPIYYYSQSNHFSIEFQVPKSVRARERNREVIINLVVNHMIL